MTKESGQYRWRSVLADGDKRHDKSSIGIVKMLINIFYSHDLKALANSVNDWLKVGGHNIEVLKMSQTTSNDLFIITLLWRSKEMF